MINKTFMTEGIADAYYLARTKKLIENEEYAKAFDNLIICPSLWVPLFKDTKNLQKECDFMEKEAIQLVNYWDSEVIPFVNSPEKKFFAQSSGRAD